jgi:hypothetical protein
MDAPKYEQNPAGTEKVIADLRDLQWHDDLQALEIYSSQLPEETKVNVDVARELAGLYFDIGDYHKAAGCIDDARLHDLMLRDGALFDRDVTCLAIISARIEMKRHLAFEAALELLNQIEEIYVHSSCKYYLSSTTPTFTA